MRTLLIGLGLSYLLLIHCTGTKSSSQASNSSPSNVEDVSAFDPQKNIIARRDLETGNYQMELEEEVFIRSFKAADFRVKVVEKVFIMHSDEKHAYLIFHAKDSSDNSLKKALYLYKIYDNIYKIATPHHSKESVSYVCEGNCCTNCEFKIKDNKLDGCACINQCASARPNLPGYCNHVISKTPGPVLVPIGQED